VDEIEIGDALPDQAVDFLQKRYEIAAAVFVAEIGQAAIVRTTARGLHLGTRAVRLAVEAVMMVVVARDPFVRPAEGRMGREGSCMNSRLDMACSVTAGHCRQALWSVAIGKFEYDFLALAADDAADAEPAQG